MGAETTRQAESPPGSGEDGSTHSSVDGANSAARSRCLSDADRARLLDQAVKDICDADFVAVDLEFTGLFPHQSSAAKRPVCLKSYFERCVQAAEFFLAPQLGICAARRRRAASSSRSPASEESSQTSVLCSSKAAARQPSGSSQTATDDPREGVQRRSDAPESAGACSDEEAVKWELAPYTFYAFPQQRKQGGVDTATLKWLLQNGLDFNEWISAGFDYIRLAELQQQARQAGAANACRHGASSGNGDMGLRTSNGGMNDGDRKPRVAAGRPADQPEGETEEAASTARREVPKSADSNRASAGGAPGGLEVTGLQRLIEAIVEKEKPLVVHNGHLDLLHVFDKFIGKVPGTLPEFCSEMLRLFTGGIYDTKHVANEGKTFVLKIGDPRTTSLVSLRHHLLRSESLCVFEIAPHRRSAFDLTFQQLNCDSGPECGRSHEAGYDALLTAQIFVMELDLYAQHHSLHESLVGGGSSDHPDDDLWVMEELRAAKKRRRRRKNKPKVQPVPLDWNTHRWYAPFRNRVGVSGVRPGYIDLSDPWTEEKPTPAMPSET
ncbi:CAF1 family ribonuclease [Toxoplasma gondii RUB]|uniref:CAF1 family ribonuclease n=1 Tax=Toxoplasma gondii RUB TaxID=935652 RepID=A0A086LK20_TOXGO|nr:CAF1 family ribonuclease [Toxoplasma gondii RUB]